MLNHKVTTETTEKKGNKFKVCILAKGEQMTCQCVILSAVSPFEGLSGRTDTSEEPS